MSDLKWMAAKEDKSLGELASQSSKLRPMTAVPNLTVSSEKTLGKLVRISVCRMLFFDTRKFFF